MPELKPAGRWPPLSSLRRRASRQGRRRPTKCSWHWVRRADERGEELDEVVFERFHADDSCVFMSTHPDPAWIEEFGPSRIRTCSISEPTMIGAAVGAAMTGLRPLVDLNRASFAFVAMEQIANQAAKLPYARAARAACRSP